MTNRQIFSYIVPGIVSGFVGFGLGRALGPVGALLAFPFGFIIASLWGALVVPYLGVKR